PGLNLQELFQTRGGDRLGGGGESNLGDGRPLEIVAGAASRPRQAERGGERDGAGHGFSIILSTATPIRRHIMDPAARDKYSRQILFPPLGEAGQEKLLASRAVIVGCGALGSLQANALARAGVGEIVI